MKNNIRRIFFFLFIIILFTIFTYNISKKERIDIKIHEFDSIVRQIIDSIVINTNKKFYAITFIDPLDFNCPPCFNNIISYLRFIKNNRINQDLPIFLNSMMNDSLFYFKMTRVLINYGIDLEFKRLNNLKDLEKSIVFIINNKKEIICNFEFPITEEDKRIIMSYINN